VIGEGSQDFNTVVQESGPGTIGGGQIDLWLVAIRNDDTASHTIRIQAICGFVN